MATTDATVPDAKVTELIHAALADRALLPAEHLVDAGYPSAAGVLEAARRSRITLVSPLGADHSPQARAGAGYGRAAFASTLTRSGRPVCRADQRPVASGHPARHRRHRDPVRRRHLPPLPGPRPVHSLDLTAARPSAHRATPGEVHQAQQAARAEHTSADWQARYAARAGVEGTINQAVAITGMRCARYRGLPKIRLQHVFSAFALNFSAVALNLIRLNAYWNGHPLDRTRTSHLSRLDVDLAA